MPQAATEDHDAPTTSPPEAAPLRGVEVLLVVVAWAFFSVLNLATGLLDGRGVGGPWALSADVEARHLAMPAVWAALTVLVLWASRHVRMDRAFWRRRAVHVLVVGVLAANVADAVSDLLWDVLARWEAAPGEVVGRRFRPALDNLTWLDDFGVFVAALAVGAARGYVLRERARREAAGRREAALEARSARAQADAARLQADAARLQAQLAEARLAALQRQLDPHFLFNTLNAVSALVERDPRGVRRMIEQLSALLRHSMNAASAPEIPLRQELDLLERYVDIMRVRFDDQLAVATRADPRALDALVPNMILQPLVENAIRHGVEQSPDGGRVEVEAAREGDALVLRVRDDGPGPAPAGGGPPNGVGGGVGGGVGLHNAEARLAQLYGAAHSLTLAPAAGGGTVAEVRLPYHTRPGVATAAGNGQAARV